ncbi:UNVERIFIED_CONTAM: TPR repeat-containing thioredoxin TDX [Sesamum radiatum]|uniref:TPR repeat-containing thioredoxin TDX n=1 Tax=Sesamum radiatum TaxID=300843 RepID=A0AAW2PMV0_SESRA
MQVGIGSDLNYVEVTKDKMLGDDMLDEDIIESDVELDNSDVVKPDYDFPKEMGDPTVVVTEEDQVGAQLSKSKAMDAILEGNFDEAINHLTVAINSNPNSATLYASRASVFVKLKKPNAAIRDADAALQINSCLAKGFKARGMAKALLGSWEAAAIDLRVASELDFDEETSMMLKRVEPFAKKIEQHRQKYERLRKERELRKIELEKLRLAQDRSTGKVIEIESSSEIGIKLRAASNLSWLTVVYFTATWSGPCHYIAPRYASLAAKYPKVVFLKVDIDKAKDVALEWNVNSIPSFYLINNGGEIDIMIDVDIDLLENKISKHSGTSEDSLTSALKPCEMKDYEQLLPV